MISVIVPAFNASKTIRQCIESILAQEFEEEFELIIVDDESTDDTRQIVRQYENVMLITQKHAGPAVARNLGAKKARGEIIIFTDSDCEAAENWLREMVAPFSDNEVAGVQGAYKTKQKSLVARFEQIDIELRYERMKKARHLDWIGSYSAAYLKNVFFDFGGFDENFPIASGEDPDLSYRIAEKGLKLVFNPKAIVFHTHPDKLKKYLKTKFSRAYWRVLLYKKHAEKAVNDSYTPQLLKFQIVLWIMALIGTLSAAVLSMLNKAEYFGGFLFAIIAILLLFVSTIPFFVFSFKKDKAVAVASLFVLPVRSLVFLAGFVSGITNNIFGKSKGD